jgi:hypothetical protein
VMVQTADVGNGDDRAAVGCLLRPWDGRVLVQREVRAPLVVVSEVLLQMAAQRTLVPDDEVVDALAPQGLDHAFDEGVLSKQRRLGRSHVMLSRLIRTSTSTLAAAVGVVLMLGSHLAAAQSVDRTQLPGVETMSALQLYTGVYRLGGDHLVGVDRFIADNGDSTLLFCDYDTGLVRPLFRVSPTEFAMGPSFAARSPVELTVQFQMDGQGAAQGLTIRPSGGPASFATKEPSRDEDVVFRHGDTSLAGTFIVPSDPGPHPAIVLLHGSGPLTRHSFGPWPRFFNSLGMAVLVYDKARDRRIDRRAPRRFDRSADDAIEAPLSGRLSRRCSRRTSLPAKASGSGSKADRLLGL